MNRRGNNLRSYGTNFSTGLEKLYVFILLASGLVAVTLNTYLVPLFKCVRVPLVLENKVKYHSASSAGAGEGE